jgi:hypothetical protein
MSEVCAALLPFYGMRGCKRLFGNSAFLKRKDHFQDFGPVFARKTDLFIAREGWPLWRKENTTALFTGDS